jgi:hypothetical protein
MSLFFINIYRPTQVSKYLMRMRLGFKTLKDRLLEGEDLLMQHSKIYSVEDMNGVSTQVGLEI